MQKRSFHQLAERMRRTYQKQTQLKYQKLLENQFNAASFLQTIIFHKVLTFSFESTGQCG